MLPTANLAGKALQERTVNWRPDPLNPKQWTNRLDSFLPNAVQTVSSLLELPDAPARPWLTPRVGIPSGLLQRQVWKSPLLSNEREVWVYTPPGYQTTGELYGLMITTDGLAYTNAIPSPTILDNLKGNGVSKQFASSSKAPLRFYLDVGLLEMGSNSGGTRQWVETAGIPYGPSMVVVNRHMREILKLKGYEVHYGEFSGGHNVIGWQSTLADGLIALIGTGRGETTRR